jgi:hypothetical protein
MSPWLSTDNLIVQYRLEDRTFFPPSRKHSAPRFIKHLSKSILLSNFIQEIKAVDIFHFFCCVGFIALTNPPPDTIVLGALFWFKFLVAEN